MTKSSLHIWALWNTKYIILFIIKKTKFSVYRYTRIPISILQSLLGNVKSYFLFLRVLFLFIKVIDEKPKNIISLLIFYLISGNLLKAKFSLTLYKIGRFLIKQSLSESDQNSFLTQWTKAIALKDSYCTSHLSFCERNNKLNISVKDIHIYMV